MTAAGFEPAPFRTAALTLRLRPLGHAVDVVCAQTIFLRNEVSDFKFSLKARFQIPDASGVLG